MAWSSLADNQIPNFTDLQTSGFTLNAGQSAVTSNECLTKSQALAKYNLSTTLMNSYATNQLVPKSGYANGSVTSYSFELERYGYSTALESCSGTNSTVTWYSSVNYLAIGQTLYFEAALINPRNGGNQWHQDYVNNRTCKIGTNGVVIDIQSCPLPYSYTLYYDYTGGGTLYNGFDLTSQACSSTTNSVTVYSSSSTITSGAELFLDLYGNTPILCIVYGGGRQYYKINGNLVRFSPDPGQSFGNTIYDVISCVTGNSFTFGTVDSESSAGACAGANTGRTLYSSDSTLSVGTHLYTDSTLTNSFIPGDGTQSYYLHSGSNSYRVTQLGIINLITACVTSYSFNFSINNTTDEFEACGFSYGQTLYSASSSLNMSTILYTDSGLVNIFNGQSRFWLGEGTPYRINATGTIYIIGETC